jgi:hypothetical protein
MHDLTIPRALVQTITAPEGAVIVVLQVSYQNAQRALTDSVWLVRPERLSTS